MLTLCGIVELVDPPEHARILVGFQHFHRHPSCSSGRSSISSSAAFLFMGCRLLVTLPPLFMVSLDPCANYVFNRSRDDPFVIRDLRFIYLSAAGPKRGVAQNHVLLEYDMKIIKRGGESGDRHRDDEEEDAPLINGVAIFSLPMWPHPTVR